METYKVVVAGTRDFDQYVLLEKELDDFLKGKGSVEIVSGTARGADRLGEKYARTRGYGLKLFPAEWEMLGRGAGHIRNAEMGKYADACVIFWDGISRGTKGMIEVAKRNKLDLLVVKYKDY